MKFLRPDAAATLARYREALIGAVVLLIGAFWAMTGHGILGWIGWAVGLLGVALLVTGLQRSRFRRGATGRAAPGVVQVDEGQIAYFGPLTGGVADCSEITSLTLDRAAHPPHWRIRQPGQGELAIPITATGGEALFDAFAALPGLRTEALLAALDSGDAHPIVIWTKPVLSLD